MSVELTASQQRVLRLLSAKDIREIDTRFRAYRVDKTLMYFRELHFAVLLINHSRGNTWRITNDGKRAAIVGGETRNGG